MRLTLAVALPAVVVTIAACGGGHSGLFDAGPVSDFPLGTVTTIAYADGHEVGRSAAGGYPVPLANLSPATIVFHVVHLEDGTILALSARDSHPARHCTVPWRPDFKFDDEPGTGWFRDPCSGSTYELTGCRVFGPSPRGLDGYPVRVRDEHVIVTLSPAALIPGSRDDCSH